MLRPYDTPTTATLLHYPVALAAAWESIPANGRCRKGGGQGLRVTGVRGREHSQRDARPEGKCVVYCMRPDQIREDLTFAPAEDNQAYRKWMIRW